DEELARPAERYRRETRELRVAVRRPRSSFRFLPPGERFQRTLDDLPVQGDRDKVAADQRHPLLHLVRRLRERRRDRLLAWADPEGDRHAGEPIELASGFADDHVVDRGPPRTTGA